MRVTNNMITGNTKNNINANKVLVDKYNTQMTTHKKINKASEDPVIAIRSLRMQTNLSHISQYLDNNIADANAWLSVTETALVNMKNILTDIRTQCVDGSTDTKDAPDRNTILKSLRALQEQIYTEGNADYAGRTVFTGYRTNCQLTFKEDEKDTEYKIRENFTYEDLKEQRYYYGETKIPIDTKNSCDAVIGTQTYTRIRLSYDGISDLGTDANANPAPAQPSAVINTRKEIDPATLTGGETVYDTEEDWIKANNNSTTLTAGAKAYYKDESGKTIEVESREVTVYDTEADWIDARRNNTVGDPDYNKVAELGKDDIVFLKDSGELIFGDDIAHTLAGDRASFEVHYEKTGFAKNELRPEYYFDCEMHTPDMKETPDKEYVKYTKQNQELSYVISSGITLSVNTQASEVFGPEIGRDVNEMIDIVSAALAANDKVAKIEQMMEQERYAGEDAQKVLKTYLTAAKEEATYANDNLQKTFSQYITNFDNYLEKVNIGITNLGSLQKRLDLTQNRVENQQMTVELLKSNNEDRDISDIIIDYYAAYNAYTASLTAASKVGQQTLLNYL